jgi:hypothetical protein
MEHFEDTLKGVTHKSLCQFHYMEGTSVTWPHGPGKLINFPDHMKHGHENIHSNMEMETDSSSSFP